MKAFAIHICLWFMISFFLFMPATGKTETLKVAFAHWPPWKIVEENRVEGIDADIVRAIGKHLEVSVEFTICPWQRCIEMANKGDVDLITSFGRTASRDKFVYYLGPPYATEHVVFYVRKDQAITVVKYADLRGKKIGTIIGSSYFTEFDEDKFLEKTPVNYERQLFEMLAAGRIDLFIGFETVIDYLLLKEGLEEKFKKSTFRITSTGSHIAMSKRSGALKWRMDITRLVTQMVSQGEIHRIIDDFFQNVAYRKSRSNKGKLQ